jgi:hypothetical protein
VLESRPAALFGRGHLDLQQPDEKGALTERVLASVVELDRKGLGCSRHAQVGEVRSPLLVERVLGHAKFS